MNVKHLSIIKKVKSLPEYANAGVCIDITTWSYSTGSKETKVVLTVVKKTATTLFRGDKMVDLERFVDKLVGTEKRRGSHYN